MIEWGTGRRLRSRDVAGLGQCRISGSGHFALVREPGQVAASPRAARSGDRLFDLSERAQGAARLTRATELDYLILVPTLRCNLSCSYCQVSRAPANHPKFDWTDETLGRVLALLRDLDTQHIKIEFQGGEPTLRIDLVREVIAACERFRTKQFVLCTNLSQLDDPLMALLANPDVYVSTSLDGRAGTHAAQRTQSEGATDTFFANARKVIETFGPDKLSALPTIDQSNPPSPDELIDAYLDLGQTSIFLRPINYQGFARKRFSASRDDHCDWWAYYDRFVDRVIERNFVNRGIVLEESYLTLCLRRIFQIGHDRHVDLRNPNPVGVDYIVIDFDGRVYPTDEARMLSRAGVVDLAIGDLEAGWDTPKRDLLNRHSSNIGDPACDACAYQPYCGRDLVDDLSRYGTISMQRHETFFCQKHLHMFDLCMRLIYDPSPAVRYSLAKWMGLAGDTLPQMAELS